MHRNFRAVEEKDVVCVDADAGDSEIGRAGQDANCSPVLFQDDNLAVRIASEPAAKDLGARGGNGVESDLEIVFFRRGLSSLRRVERGIIKNDSDPARGGEIEASLSDAGIVQIVGEHLDLDSVIIQCLVEYFVNLASGRVTEPEVHVLISEIAAVHCSGLLCHVEKPIAGGFELGLSAIMAGVSLRFQKRSGETNLEAAFGKIADGDRDSDGPAGVEREELSIDIEESRRGVVIPIAQGHRLLRIAARKVYPFECLKWRIDR